MISHQSYKHAMFKTPSRSFPLSRGEQEVESQVKRSKYIITSKHQRKADVDTDEEEKEHQYFLDLDKVEEKEEPELTAFDSLCYLMSSSDKFYTYKM